MKKHLKSVGFTIIELIIVIVIIGILSSIMYFIMSGWRVEAARTEVKNDLKNIEVELEGYRNFHNDYPTNLDQIDYEKTETVDVSYSYDATQGTYCINASSNVESSVQYFSDTSSDDSLAEGTC